jgi:hypothetical protein
LTIRHAERTIESGRLNLGSADHDRLKIIN